jgi:hypothetical protein
MAKKVMACRIRFLSAPQASGSRPQHVVTRYGMAPAAQPGARLRPEHARQKLRLWGHPVRMSCKNFLANLFPRDMTMIAASDSPSSWAFNDGICEAQCSALGGRQQYPTLF